MKKILITGANSYIGTSFEKYVKENENFEVDTLDMLNDDWKNYDFSKYDTVFHVAGIAHNSSNKKMDDLYLKVNRDLAIETANLCKKSGVKQFIFMSSMIIYGDDYIVGKIKIINESTIPNSKHAYGRSKLEADLELQKMNNNDFKVVVIRTPMVYGDNCKGNYSRLVKIALKLPIIPRLHNQRSVIEINNLARHICEYIKSDYSGVVYPQDDHYFDTFEVMKKIRLDSGKKVRSTILFNWLIIFLSIFIKKFRKIWGSKIYCR